MTCSQVRLALSARLDGESAGVDDAGVDDTGIDDAGVDDHVAGCAGCRRWFASAGQVTALVRQAGRAATPDLTELVLARVAVDRQVGRVAAVTRDARRHRVLRFGLGAFAAVQLLLAMPGVLGIDPHPHHEIVAFAVAFLLAAFRPTLARAYAPIALVLAGCLVLTATVDLVQGVTTFGHETSQLLTIVPAVMLVALAYRSGGPAARPAAPVRERVAMR